MSRRNTEHLAHPPKKFNASRTTERKDGVVNFETARASSAEDARRQASLKKGKGLKRKKRTKAQALAKRLRCRAGDVGSLASSYFMRHLRKLVVGALWQLVNAVGCDKVSTFTVIPRSWEISADQLLGVDPRILLERFRQKLIRASKGQKGGWLFAAIHGEYEPTRNVYQLHIHGIACGNMIKAVDHLRKRSDFKKVKDAKGETVYLRVRISRKPLTDLPDPLTYILQAFWPARAAYKRGYDDQTRQRKKRRIAEPHHSHVLLWLDKWRLRHITLMIGLRVTKDGLKITNPKTNTN